MIDNPKPENWRELQYSVCRLLREIGLTAETEKKLQTPRGEVEIDVWAVDENSVDKIVYIVECKNWEASIPQTVVHSLTTVMSETGGNIGFIISKNGLQSGAKEYLKNTNIVGLTYLELQHRYLELWWKKYFMLKVGSAVDTLVQYVEPINSKRERLLKELSPDKKDRFQELMNRYVTFGITMAFFEFPMYSNQFDIPVPEDLSGFKDKLRSELGEEFSFQSEYYRDLCDELCLKIEEVTNKFNDVFGGDIFA